MGATLRSKRPANRPVALAGLVALALSITAVGAAPHAAAADKPSAQSTQSPPERPTTERERAEDAALAEAKRTGKPVPVPAATTETDTVVANPDGTLGLTRSVAPVRTKRDGSWAELDATLIKAGDGTLHPKASVSGLTLSGGGAAPLATLDQDGKQLVLSWPEPLPVPVLEGASAVYREVVAGTDLKVTADEGGGISQILVVKSAEAAKNPKLAKLTMGLKGEGVTVSADGHGNLKAADTSGRTVFQAPTPTMWDSTTPVQAPLAKSSGAGVFSRSVMGAMAAPSETPDEGGIKAASDSEGPGDSAKTTRLPADLGKDSVTLTPDQAFLTDPDTAYPVYIDPAWTPTNRGSQHWAWIQEAYENTTSYDDYADTYDPGVGYQRWREKTGLERYYVQLNTSDLSDKSIKKASFFATQSYAADATCSKTYNVDLHSTEPLLPDITWKTQPRDWEVLRTTSLNSAGGSGCATSTTRGEWDVRDHLAANEWRGSITYALFASNEAKSGTNNSFKRFTRDKNNLPFLYIEYNRAPYAPWDLGTFPTPKNPNGNGCGWVGATAYAGMSIGAWTGDPEDNATQSRFVIYDANGNTVAYESGWIGLAGGNHWVQTYPTGLLDGHSYWWQVQTGDGDLSSPWVRGCTFTMDTQPPSVPVVTSTEYPPSGTLPGSTKYVGQSGNFKVSASDVGSGVLFYEWAFGSVIPVGGANRADATADGSVTIPLTPTGWGTNILRVQSVDRAGNRSQQQTYIFYVPDNPNAKTTLGDITDDDRVDFLAPADNGDLIIYPTATDPAAGGLLASDVANSPGGGGWGEGTLTTHRGGNGIPVDDLWTFRGGQLKVYRNSLSKLGGLGASKGLYFIQENALPVARPYADDCIIAATSQPCGTAYVENWSQVKQILAVGDALPETGVTAQRNDLLTVESDGTGSKLMLFQGTGSASELRDPLVLVLSASGWDDLKLIAPGDATGDGLADLWARDKKTGDLYQYANVAGNPAALGDHTKRTKIGTGFTDTTFSVVGSSGDTSADGVPDLWALDKQHRLRTWNGTATSGKVTGLGAPRTMGDARISTAHWKLNEATGTAAADLRARNNATLSATGATRADDTVAGTATKVIDLNGTTGTITATGPAVDTSGSFTVSAWAKATPGKPGVVLSQDGQRTSAFTLSYDADGYWHFAMARKDDDSGTVDDTLTRNDAAKAQAGVWTQLTATHDSTTGLIALYVNGTLAGTGHHAKANVWKATGPFTIGRNKIQAQPSRFFTGRVSNVTVYDHSTVPSANRTTLVSGVSSAKCVDDDHGSDSDGTRIHLWDCNAVPGASQLFDVREDGELRVVGKCLDASNNGTANNTPVVLWTCGTASPNQQWLPTATGGFYNPVSGRCLDLPHGRTDNGTQLELYDCNAGNNQRWTATGLTTPLGAAG